MIDQPTKQSHGGVCKVWVYDLANGVTTFPDVVNHIIEDAIVFAGGNDWVEMDFTRWKVRPKEDEVNSGGAIVYRFSLSGTAALDTAERVQALYEASRKEYLVKYQDQNGMVKLIGSPDNPVAISMPSRDNGQQYADGSIMEISMRSTNKFRFPEYRV